MVISIILMTVDHHTSHLNSTRALLGTALYPLHLLASLPSDSTNWASITFAERRLLLEQNHRLGTRNLLLQEKLLKFSYLQEENSRLRELLDSTRRLPNERVLIAELLAVDLDPFKQRIVINKGTRDGVYIGQPLVDARGLLGQITHITLASATAILITDPSHSLLVQVDRNGQRALAEGTGGSKKLKLLYVPTNADIRLGDVLSTSGLDGRYPSEYPVGKVTNIVRQPGDAFLSIEAQPFGQLDQSREVLLIWINDTGGLLNLEPEVDDPEPVIDDTPQESEHADE